MRVSRVRRSLTHAIPTYTEHHCVADVGEWLTMKWRHDNDDGARNRDHREPKVGQARVHVYLLERVYMVVWTAY